MEAVTPPDRRRVVAERLRTACDLWEAGVALQRQRLHREHPGASTAEIDTLVRRWLQTRPGAECGDGPQPRR
jgi:hypothetical protein